MDKINISKLASIFSLSTDCVVGILGGVVQFANRSAGERFGMDVCGKNAAEVIPDYILDDPSEEFTATANINGESVVCKATRVDDVLVIAIPAEEKDTAARLYGFIPVLNSSMSTLRIAADRLVEKVDMDFSPELKTYAAALYHSYFTLLRTTGMLADLMGLDSGMTSFSMQPEDMEELVYDLVGTVNHFSGVMGIEIIFDCDPGDYSAMLDKSRIEQLILNILVNSLRHTPSGGSIRLKLSRRGGRIVLSVSDQGGGMDAHTLSTAFDVNGAGARNLNSLGTGAGLALAQRIAGQHGGAIMIDTVSGKGTQVTLLLPAGLPDDWSRLSEEPARYRAGGMRMILTELSPVLPSEFYCEKYFD